MSLIPRIQSSWWPSLLTLIAANLVPFVGAIALDWNLGQIMLVYWVESAIILFFSLIKVAIVARLAAIGLIPFFLVHAGIFMGVHLVFLLALFVSWVGINQLLLGAATLFVSHLVSFIVNVVRNKERPASAQAVMTGFYSRIVVMQLTIIFGAMLLGILGSPVWALVLLIVLKTAVDAGAHLRERAKHAPGDKSPAQEPAGLPTA